MSSKHHNFHISLELNTSRRFGNFDPTAGTINLITWDINPMAEIISNHWKSMWYDVHQMIDSCEKKNRGIPRSACDLGLVCLPVSDFVNGVKKELKERNLPVPSWHVKEKSVGVFDHLITIKLMGFHFPPENNLVCNHLWKQFAEFADLLEHDINVRRQSMYENLKETDSPTWVGPKLTGEELSTFASEVANLFCNYCPDILHPQEDDQFRQHLAYMNAKFMDHRLPTIYFEESPCLAASRTFMMQPTSGVIVRYSSDSGPTDISIDAWSQYKDFCAKLVAEMKSIMRRR